jgi:hypothetical protein
MYFSLHKQQQLSLLSQASWGRLEMKPTRNKGRRSTKLKRKRKDHVSGTLIASLQALLSLTNSLGMSHSLRSLLTDSSQVSLGRPLPLLTLPREASSGHDQTISTGVGPMYFSLQAIITHCKS